MSGQGLSLSRSGGIRPDRDADRNRLDGDQPVQEAAVVPQRVTQVLGVRALAVPLTTQSAAADVRRMAGAVLGAPFPTTGQGPG